MLTVGKYTLEKAPEEGRIIVTRSIDCEGTPTSVRWSICEDRLERAIAFHSIGEA